MKNYVLWTMGCLFLSIGFSVQAKDSVKVMQEQLQYQLDQYSTCQKKCSMDLASDLFNGGVEVALATFALDEVATKSNKVLFLAAYAYLRLIYVNGKSVVLNQNVCSNKCDAMYADVVSLGRKGALGPLVKGRVLDDAFFNDPEIINLLIKYIKPVKPSDLPAHFHNELWWNEIQRTG